MLLTYDAIDGEGRKTTDTVDARDPAEAVDTLRSRGLYVTNIAEADRPTAAADVASGDAVDVRLPLKRLVVFTRQMAMLLRAGSSVVPAVAAIKRQITNPVHASLFTRIIRDLEEGLTLTEALGKHPKTFSGVYCAIVAAGEASGSLNTMFDRLAEVVVRQRTVRNQILGALAYPALLVVMSGSILISLLFFVVPSFAEMFEQLAVEPPASTRFLLAAATIIQGYWVFFLVAGAILVIGGGLYLVSDRGRQWISDMQLALPIIGRMRSLLIQAHVFRTMGMLLESRVGILETLELARRSTRNGRFQKLFQGVEDSVVAGSQVHCAFDESGLIDATICQAIETGEETGELGGALTFCADTLDETNSELITVTMKLLEPLILIVMGFLVGGVAVSLFMPLFDLTSAMQ